MTRHLHVWCVVLERAAMVIRLMEQACTCCMMHGGAAIELRLVEQACTCYTMQDDGGLKVRARLCVWHSDGECLLS